MSVWISVQDVDYENTLSTLEVFWTKEDAVKFTQQLIDEEHLPSGYSYRKTDDGDIVEWQRGKIRDKKWMTSDISYVVYKKEVIG